MMQGTPPSNGLPLSRRHRRKPSNKAKIGESRSVAQRHVERLPSILPSGLSTEHNVNTYQEELQFGPGQLADAFRENRLGK